MQTQVRSSEPIALLTSTGKPSGCWLCGWKLVRRAQASKHLLRRPPAWAFEERILREAERLGASVVQVTDTETGCVYTAPLQAFWTRGFALDRGFALQRALPLCFWRREDPRQPTLF